MTDITTPHELLMLNPSTQTQVDLFSDSIIQEVKSGEVDPLQVLIQLKAFEKASKRILSEIHVNIMKKAEDYHENSFDFLGNKLTKAEHGTTYNYDRCNDPVYVQRLKIVNEAKEQLEERAEFLKSIKGPVTIVHDETGEVFTILPPMKKSTPGLNVSIK